MLVDAQLPQAESPSPAGPLVLHLRPLYQQDVKKLSDGTVKSMHLLRRHSSLPPIMSLVILKRFVPPGLIMQTVPTKAVRIANGSFDIPEGRFDEETYCQHTKLQSYQRE